MKQSVLYEVVDKLIGPIQPVGDASKDGKRFDNLKLECVLAEYLLDEIHRVAYHHKNAPEHSRKKAGQYANDFLAEMQRLE